MGTVIGILIPFLGTALGAACVFLMRGEMRPEAGRVLSGFAAGIMAAACVWSLLLPTIGMSAALGRLAFFPAAVGFAAGIFFLLFLDRKMPQAPVREEARAERYPAGHHAAKKKTAMLVLAVTLHNIPEGMAIGAVFAGMRSDHALITLSGALVLSVGIAVQNIPEGAIISMPLASVGAARRKAFLCGVLSGVVEPLGALTVILLAEWMEPYLPYLLAFAAGAMMYVVVEELVPEAVDKEQSHVGTVFFATGFLLMMILDVALG